ncbi:hypothetical protein GOODEAATRI_010615 [Goodea atripinnis]|uniref:E3 ubiquitin-protein ligase listerin n=1 Tax=Goodea atripinnis TaxID=208336 RepID=A0ABV0MR26_9TELE
MFFLGTKDAGAFKVLCVFICWDVVKKTHCLCGQNGSIMEGLALWKNNVDKRFEGIEDCMICFSVIHGSNYSLPKKACRTCKKKFHSACLVRRDIEVLMCFKQPVAAHIYMSFLSFSIVQMVHFQQQVHLPALQRNLLLVLDCTDFFPRRYYYETYPECCTIGWITDVIENKSGGIMDKCRAIHIFTSYMSMLRYMG